MNIGKIIDQTQKETDKQIYAKGILDIVDFLISDLWPQLKKENRLRGIVLDYRSTITDAFDKIHKEEQYSDIYGRILYLHRGLIKKEYNRLVIKKLSPADSIITISRRLLSIILENSDIDNKGSIEEIKNIVDKLWDYIKNKAKNDFLFNLADKVKTNMNNGYIGKHPIDELSLEEKEYDKKPIEGSGIIIKDEPSTFEIEI